VTIKYETKILKDGHRVEQGATLKEIADMEARLIQFILFKQVKPSTLHPYFAGIGREQAYNVLNEYALARTGASHYDDTLPLGDLQTYVREDGFRTK
jgi:hypothetical protein